MLRLCKCQSGSKGKGVAFIKAHMRLRSSKTFHRAYQIGMRRLSDSIFNRNSCAPAFCYSGEEIRELRMWNGPTVYNML